MISFLHTLVAFAVVIGVLVFVHELGHYLAARWRGVTVEVFSIGFGRELFGWTDRAGTRWRIAAIPLGGYVRMVGQSDFGVAPEGARGGVAPEGARDRVAPDGARDRVAPDGAPHPVMPAAAPAGTAMRGHNSGESGSFADKSVLSRAIVVAAGPAFNVLFAILLLSAVFMTIGRPTDRPVVAAVVAGSPAASAGFRTGDAIVSVAGEPMRHVASVPAAVASHAGETITVGIRRGNALLSVPVTPRAVLLDGNRVGQLGIEVGASLASVRLSPPEAVVEGVRDTAMIAGGIGAGLWRIATGGGGTADLGGPLRIAQVSGEAAHQGAASFLLLIAMISVNLALVNLLPVPVLDGGYLVFFLIEAVLGRPLSRRLQLAGLQAGLALIGTLFIFVTFNDLTSFGLFRWVRALAG